MQVQLAGGNYRRSYGLAPQRLQNLLIERMPDGRVMRFPRGGLSLRYTVGSGPMRGLFAVDGVFGGDIFTVSGGDLYRGDTSIGACAGIGPVRWATSKEQLVILTGTQPVLYDGVSLTAIVDPDLPTVADITYLSGRFIYAAAASDRFYWSAINDAGNIDGLAFATAEGAPDNTVGLSTLVDDLYVFGSQSTEIWSVTGDADDPFERSPGRRYNRGCAARGTIVQADNALLWVGDNRVVYRTSAIPVRVSDSTVEQALSNCSNISACGAWTITREGHELYILTIPGQGTHCYDFSTQTWVEWTSYGLDTFVGTCGQLVSGEAYVGGQSQGAVYSLRTGVYSDVGQPITWLASFQIAQPGGVAPLNNLVLQGARGVGTSTGLGVDPVTELRLSRTQGQSWDDWLPAGLGPQGEYGHRAVWTRLGKVVEPGVVGEIRTTDPVLCSMVDVLVNADRPFG